MVNPVCVLDSEDEDNQEPTLVALLQLKYNALYNSTFIQFTIAERTATKSNQTRQERYLTIFPFSSSILWFESTNNNTRTNVSRSVK